MHTVMPTPDNSDMGRRPYLQHGIPSAILVSGDRTASFNVHVQCIQGGSTVAVSLFADGKNITIQPGSLKLAVFCACMCVCVRERDYKFTPMCYMYF
jgi:hypothetical protein